MNKYSKDMEVKEVVHETAISSSLNTWMAVTVTTLQMFNHDEVVTWETFPSL